MDQKNKYTEDKVVLLLLLTSYFLKCLFPVIFEFHSGYLFSAFYIKKISCDNCVAYYIPSLNWSFGHFIVRIC